MAVTVWATTAAFLVQTPACPTPSSAPDNALFDSWQVRHPAPAAFFSTASAGIWPTCFGSMQKLESPRPSELQDSTGFWWRAAYSSKLVDQAHSAFVRARVAISFLFVLVILLVLFL
jgi:hypothetical protein